MRGIRREHPQLPQRVPATVEEYDPQTNSWSTLLCMPTPRYGLAATTVSGKVYAIGGYFNGYRSTNEEFDLKNIAVYLHKRL